MKKHLAPCMLGALLLLCCASKVLAQDASNPGPPGPTDGSSVVVPEPSASSAVSDPVVSPSSGIVSSSDPALPKSTESSTAVSVSSSIVKATASSSQSSSKPTESAASSNSEEPSDANTVNVFGFSLGIIPLIAIVLGLALIILYIVMRCILRRRKMEMRRMRASFADMRNRFNRTMTRPKNTVIPASRPSATPRKVPPSSSNASLYPSMSQNESNASLNWTPPVQPQSGFGDPRYAAEQGYQRRNYHHPDQVTQPPPVHQQQPPQLQQQQAYPQPHGYTYGYGSLQRVDGMYGVVDGYYGYTQADHNYQQSTQPNPYILPQPAYRPEASDGSYHINMEQMELPPTPQQHYQNDYSGVYANVNYYPEGTQYPQRTSTTQHYDQAMLRPRRSSSRGTRPSMPYGATQFELPLPSPREEEKEPRGLRAVNVASPTSPSQAAIPEKTGDDSAV